MNEVTVSSACKCLGVSTSGYYAWRKCQANLAQKYNDLKAVYWQHHARLGAPSLVHDMHDLDYNMSERTIGRMLKKLGLRSRIARKYKHTTDSTHRLPTAPNYKIGFTRNSVMTRLDGCEDDIAFLESKVRVVASIECKNMDPHVFERMIHTFFAVQRLNMMLKAKDGKMYKPQEWFNVELETILEVAQRIIDKSIIHFRMDNTTGRVVLKKQ